MAKKVLGDKFEEFEKMIQLEKLDLNRDKILDFTDLDIALKQGDEKLAKKIAAERLRELREEASVIVVSSPDAKLLFTELGAEVHDIIELVAEALGIEWEGIGKKIKKKIVWEWYCPACGKIYEKKGMCEICGSPLKRRPKVSRQVKKEDDRY